MIQRVQTVWLAILAVLSLSLIKGGIILFNAADGSLITLGFSGVTAEKADAAEVLIPSIGLPLTIIAIPVFAIAAIFLYKKLKLQKTVTLLVIAFSLCLVIMTGYYWFEISNKFSGLPVTGFKMAFPPVILVLAVMAYRGIIKDDRLLKSYDRLR